MIPQNQLYLVTDKTTDGIYELLDAASKSLIELNDKDTAIQLIFDAMDMLEDLPAVSGIEGRDRPGIPGK